MRLTVGIDLGYGNVKADSGERKLIFPSLVAPNYKENPVLLPNISGNGIQPDQRFALRVGEETFAVGAEALSSQSYRKISRGAVDDFDIHLFLFPLAVLSLAYNEVAFSVGIPFHFLKAKDEIEKIIAKLEGRLFEVTLIDLVSQTKIDKKILVERVFPIRQGLATLWDRFVHRIEQGRFIGNFKELLEGTMLVVDIGTGTTELVVVSKNRVLQKHSRSIKAGIYDVVDGLSDYLSKNYGYSGVSSVLIEQEIIKKGERVFKNGKIDLTDVVEKLKSQLWQRIEAEIATLLGLVEETKIFAKKRVLFTGGGSLFLQKEIQKFAATSSDIDVLYSENLLFSNASGARKFAIFNEMQAGRKNVAAL